MKRNKLMLWDVECDSCDNVWEDWANGVEAPLCPRCGGAFTRLLPGGLKYDKAKEPYDYLDRGIPDSKRIFSGPKVHSK